MTEMSGKSNLHICHFMIPYLEDMSWIKALVENLNCMVLENENWAKFSSALLVGKLNYTFADTKINFRNTIRQNSYGHLSTLLYYIKIIWHQMFCLFNPCKTYRPFTC